MKKSPFLIICAILIIALFSCSGDTPEPTTQPEPKVFHKITLKINDTETKEYEVEKGTEWSFPELAETEDGHYPVVAEEEDGHIIPLEIPIKIDRDRKFTIKWTDWKFKAVPQYGRFELKDKSKPGKDTEIYIPYVIDEMKITSLNTNAFNESEIEIVHIPDWIDTIDGGLSKCTKIKELTIPASVKRVNQLALSTGNPNLKLIVEDGKQILNWEYSWRNGFSGTLEVHGEGVIEKDGIA